MRCLNSESMKKKPGTLDFFVEISHPQRADRQNRAGIGSFGLEKGCWAVNSPCSLKIVVYLNEE